MLILTRLKTEKRYQIILWGLYVHFLLLIACFDLYFASPLDKGILPVKSTTDPPAKRLVLFVADGLRAEAIYGDNKESRIPFLNKMKTFNGTWGISHTRVPTESRPGHVALLGGIYEDPSAILKGWKANPVEFDSVINRSTNAFCYGSPDILKIFENIPDKHLEYYSATIEDFGDRNSSVLDLWVFNKVEELLTKNISNCLKLQRHKCDKFSNGTIYFLHLLGIDTAGHGFKPHSPEYINNIKLVDTYIEQIVHLFESVFQDDKTAYIFTSDHGMTDWGSHGAGTPHETESPIIAWGAGIKRNRNKINTNQINLAPLISSLIGIDFPVHSLGVVPMQFLHADEESLVKILLANVLQLVQSFNVKRLRIEGSALIHIPFEGNGFIRIAEKLVELRNLLMHKQFTEIKYNAYELIDFVKKGFDYYHYYYQIPILISISIGFSLWILFLTVSILGLQNQVSGTVIQYFVLAIVIFLCYYQKFPLTYYLHFTFPVFMIFKVWKEKTALKQILRYTNKIGLKSLTYNLVFYLLGLELLMTGFFHRVSYTFLMILIGIWIPLTPTLRKNVSRKERILWFLFCSILSVFPMLPVMKTFFNVPLYLTGCVTWSILFLEMYLNRLRVYKNSPQISANYKIFLIQFICLIFSAIYILLLHYEYISNDSNFKYLSWILFIIPLSLIPLSSTIVAIRLIATFFAFAPFYLLVSPNFEILFSAFYVATLCLWLLIESKSFSSSISEIALYYTKFDIYKTTSDTFQSDSFRRAFLFMVFIFVGFFGTGNIASLNSFDPMWTRAFLTVFSPFKMMGLILLKIMVPFIFTCCVFRAINSVKKDNVMSIFCIILIFSDVMVLQFLYLVTNQGSWLEIGTSLSHFIIMEGFVTVLLLLYGIAYLLTSISY